MGIKPVKNKKTPVEESLPGIARPPSADYDDLIAKLPKAFVERVYDLPRAYFYLNEKELKQMVRPDFKLEMLRDAFWREYERARIRDTKIAARDVYGGILTDSQWRMVYTDNKKLMYLLVPPLKYEQELETLLRLYGTDTLRHICTMDTKVKVFDKEGSVIDEREDASLLRVKLAAVRQIEERLKGMAVQRIEEKSVHVEAKINVGVMTDEEVKALLEKTNSQLAKIEGELNRGNPFMGEIEYADISNKNLHDRGEISERSLGTSKSDEAERAEN